MGAHGPRERRTKRIWALVAMTGLGSAALASFQSSPAVADDLVRVSLPAAVTATYSPGNCATDGCPATDGAVGVNPTSTTTAGGGIDLLMHVNIAGEMPSNATSRRVTLSVTSPSNTLRGGWLPGSEMTLYAFGSWALSAPVVGQRGETLGTETVGDPTPPSAPDISVLPLTTNFTFDVPAGQDLPSDFVLDAPARHDLYDWRAALSPKLSFATGAGAASLAPPAPGATDAVLAAQAVATYVIQTATGLPSSQPVQDVLARAGALSSYLNSLTGVPPTTADGIASKAQDVMLFLEYAYGQLPPPPALSATVVAAKATDLLSYVQATLPDQTTGGDAATPDAQHLSVCVPHQLVSVAPQSDGGSVYSYRDGAGLVQSYGQPAATFDAGTATDSQLAAYNYPPRPADGADRQDWLDTFGGTWLHDLPAPCTRPDTAGSPADATAGADAATSGTGGSHTPVTNWAGPLATAGDDAYYKSASAIFVDPTFKASCKNAVTSNWVGLGGLNAPGKPKEGLLQDGSYYDANSRTRFLWYETIQAGHSGNRDPEKLTRYSMGSAVSQGDRIQAFAQWNDSTRKPSHYERNLTTRVTTPTPSFDYINGGNAGAYYNGRNVEYITERNGAPSGPLAAFNAISWGSAVNKGRSGGEQRVDQRPSGLLDMQNFDSSGARSGRLMAKVRNPVSNGSWTTDYFNCTP